MAKNTNANANKNTYTVEVSRGIASTKEGTTKMYGISAAISVNGEKVCDINDIAVKDGAKGTFVDFPSRKYESGGQTRYQKYVYLSEDAMKAVSDAVLEYFDEQG